MEQLIKQLGADLKKLPAEKREEAETVAELTQDLVEEAGHLRLPLETLTTEY